MVNTEQRRCYCISYGNYNILNIVVNTELAALGQSGGYNYNILNIVVNTEQFYSRHYIDKIITY